MFLFNSYIFTNIFTHLKVWVAVAKHTFKWVKMRCLTQVFTGYRVSTADEGVSCYFSYVTMVNTVKIFPCPQ